MDTESVKSAIRKAVDERKEKTWYDFHGVAYEEMYEFLGDKYVTIPKNEYEHLLRCKEELTDLRKSEKKTEYMRTEIRTKIVRNEVYIASDGKEFETKSACENHEKMLNGTRKKCSRCDGTGRINGRYKTVRDLLHFTEEERYVYDECPECGGKGYLEKVITTEWR